MHYTFYNTGDQIWFRYAGKDRFVTKVLTHDGLSWSEENPIWIRLEGVELVIHRVTVFLARTIKAALA